MYKYHLKENSKFKVGDTRIKGGKKSTITDINPETGAITWSLEDVGAFDTVYKTFDKLNQLVKKLESEGEAEADPTIDSIADQVKKLFNQYRTHIRKNYPEAYERVLMVKESNQWTQLDVNNSNKSLNLTLKTLNNLIKNIGILKAELSKHQNKPQGNILHNMVPSEFDYSGLNKKLTKLQSAFVNIFGNALKEELEIGGKKVKRINKNNSNNPEDYTVEYEDGTSEPYVDTLEENEGKVDWDNIAKEVADKIKSGYWPWAIKNGVENITRSDLGSVLVNGGYTTDSGIRKNIGGLMDKILALVKESVNEIELIQRSRINDPLERSIPKSKNEVPLLSGKRYNVLVWHVGSKTWEDEEGFMTIEVDDLEKAKEIAKDHYQDDTDYSWGVWDNELGEIVFTVGNAHKSINESIKKPLNENMAAIAGMLASTNAMLGATRGMDSGTGKFNLGKWFRSFIDDIKIKRIVKRLIKDPEIIDLVNKHTNVDKDNKVVSYSNLKGIQNILKNKLKPDEMKYLKIGWGPRLRKAMKLSESVDEGEGIGYLTPKAFDKNKKSTGANDIYYYKLGYKPVPKKIKGSGLEVKQLFEKEELTEYSDFQQKRINAFDQVEDKLNTLSPLLSNAKSATAEFYNENPGSYAIVYSTDMVNELLDDIIELLKLQE